MRSARASLLLPVALLAWGCSEATAPVTAELTRPPVDVAASFSRDNDGSGPAGHDDNGRDDRSRGDRSGRIDLHAVNVTIKAMVFGNIVIDEYDFHVQGRPGDMKGRFRLYQLRTTADGQSEAVVIAKGRMICGTIAGNKGRAAGVITETSFPEGLPTGQELIWSVTDNGKSENALDFASQPLGAPVAGQLYCESGGPYPEQLLKKGQIKLRD